MSHTTTFTCDLCGKQEVDNQSFLRGVSVVMESPYCSTPKSTNVPKASWCKQCLVKMGLVHIGNTNLPPEAAPVVPPTLEEVVRAIVQEEIKAERS